MLVRAIQTRKMVEEFKKKNLDKDYQNKSWREIVDAPISAIKGVSEGDIEDLKRAFNINTIQDLASNRFIRIAQTIVALAEIEELEAS